MTAITEIQIDEAKARAKLRRMSVAAESNNEKLRSLSRRYAELIDARVKLEMNALPTPPADPQRPLPRRRSHVASRYAHPSVMHQTPIDEWRDRYVAEQMRLAELDDEIDEVLRTRDALAETWAANARVLAVALAEFQRRTGKRLESF
jgi:epoxyqueuosine reductase QueG